MAINIKIKKAVSLFAILFLLLTLLMINSYRDYYFYKKASFLEFESCYEHYVREYRDLPNTEQYLEYLLSDCGYGDYEERLEVMKSTPLFSDNLELVYKDSSVYYVRVKNNQKTDTRIDFKTQEELRFIDYLLSENILLFKSHGELTCTRRMFSIELFKDGRLINHDFDTINKLYPLFFDIISEHLKSRQTKSMLFGCSNYCYEVKGSFLNDTILWEVICEPSFEFRNSRKIDSLLNEFGRKIEHRKVSELVDYFYLPIITQDFDIDISE